MKAAFQSEESATASASQAVTSGIFLRSVRDVLRHRAGAWRRAARLEPVVGGSLLVIAFVLICAVAPHLVAPNLPTEMDSGAILLPPARGRLFGTDQFGRDVFSLVVYGARQSVLTGTCAVLLASTVGAAFGLIAGYAGGWVDMVMMRIVDVWMSIPPILLAIALATALGASRSSTILAISILAVPRFARVLRGQALAARSRPYIEAARVSGASHWAILRGHVLPHCLAPLLVLATLSIAYAVVMSSTLSFLGLGVNDECPDWGYLLAQGRGYLTVAWWTVTFPGLAVTAFVVSANLLGDALRRRTDPHGSIR
jgi:peptide/nickel transport system permease protein